MLKTIHLKPRSGVVMVARGETSGISRQTKFRIEDAARTWRVSHAPNRSFIVPDVSRLATFKTHLRCLLKMIYG